MKKINQEVGSVNGKTKKAFSKSAITKLKSNSKVKEKPFTKLELKVNKVLSDLDNESKLAKKTNKPVKNVVFDCMTNLVGKLNMDYFRAVALLLQRKKFSKDDIADAELTCAGAWGQISRELDVLRLDLFKLCKNGKWELARAILAEFETALTRFLYRHFSYATVKWFVDESVKTKSYSEAQYLPQFGVVYSGVKHKVKVNSELVTDEAIQSFFENIRSMGELGIALTDQLREDIYNKQYKEEWDKYSLPLLTINDIFKDSESREIALSKLIQLSVFDWSKDGLKPELTFMQNYKEVGKRGKKGSGLKRMLGAWLDACEKKDLLNPTLNDSTRNDTTRAFVVLNFFGLRAKSENDVREMIGKKTKESGYVEHFENW